MTTAARGAFTSTFTVVAVPLLVGLSGRRVAWTTWASAGAPPPLSPTSPELLVSPHELHLRTVPQPLGLESSASSAWGWPVLVLLRCVSMGDIDDFGG